MLNIFKTRKKDSGQEDALDSGKRNIELLQLKNANSTLKERLSLLEKENEQLKLGLGLIQSDLADAVSINRDAIGNFKRLESNFSEIVDQADQSSTDIDNLLTATSGTAEIAQKINDSVKKVVESVKTIEGITLKSQMLAFNASIEAARAGAAGLGFAVVAEEVQNLSKSTNTHLANIKSSVHLVENITKNMSDSMGETLERTQNVSENLKRFNQGVMDAIESNQDSMQKVYGTNDRIFMSLAKLDHIIWKINTYLSVIKEKPQFQFVDHKSCRLGKWYYEGDGQENFSNVSCYHRLEDPHARVHNATASIFESLQGNTKDIKKLIQEMESASMEVFTGLDKILDEKHS